MWQQHCCFGVHWCCCGKRAHLPARATCWPGPRGLPTSWSQPGEADAWATVTHRCMLLGLSGAILERAVPPRSERAYSHISREFDVLFQALQADADATRAAAAPAPPQPGSPTSALRPASSALMQLPPAGAPRAALPQRQSGVLQHARFEGTPMCASGTCQRPVSRSRQAQAP